MAGTTTVEVKTPLDQFIRELAEKPDDWVTRGVFADWAEDNDKHQLAECLRWMVSNRKRPYHSSTSTEGGTWFNAGTIAEGLGDAESDLPAELYTLLEGGNEVANHKSYKSRDEVERVTYAAWTKAREAGWDPDKKEEKK